MSDNINPIFQAPSQNSNPDDSQPLAPPPEMEYQSQQELYQAAQNWAKEHGYAIIITHSSTSNGENRFTYQCDKSGSCHSHKKEGDQLSKTKKTNCPFKMSGNFYKKRGVWQIKIKDPNHNHSPSSDPSIHPIHRRLNEDQKSLVTQLTNAGVAPLKIKSALMQQSDAPPSATLNTIYNHRNQLRSNLLEGRTSIEALIFEIRKNNFYHMIEISPGNSHMSSLFFAHPQSLTLAKRFPTTFILDCTYKTNKFRMPLLHIIGINSSNKSFSIALCFMPAEKKDNYAWALEQLFIPFNQISPSVLLTDNKQALINAITKVFPNSTHLLCSWHIFKNIQLHCRKHFKSEEEWSNFRMKWNNLIQSSSVSEYQNNFTEFSVSWNPPTGDYLIKNIFPLKEKFVSCFINKHLHFGNTVTSRIEGLHSYIKRFVNTSTSSLSAVVKQIHQALTIQLHERFIEAAQHSYKQLTGLPPSIQNLNGQISHYALKTIHSFHMAKPPNSTCSGSYTSHMGMPCIHQVHEAKRKGTKFQPEDFHLQWHIKKELDVSFFFKLWV